MRKTASPPMTDAAAASPAWLGWAGVGLVVGAGFVLRGWILSGPFGRVDSDEAVTGLMARHFLQAEWTTFYWGSNYGGSIESIVAAPFSLLCNSAVVMKVLTILLYGVGLVLTWRLGRQTVGNRAGVLGALIAWIAPGAFVLITTKSRGWYGAAIILGLTAMLLVLRLAEESNRRWLAGLGVVLGLSLWTSPVALYLTVPAVAWLVARRPSVLREIWIAVPAALATSAPWWVYNIRSGWAGLKGGAAPFSSAYFDNLAGFFTDMMPRSLGLRMTYAGQWLGGLLAQLAYVLLIVLFAIYAFRTLRSGGPSTLLITVVLAYPFLLSLAEVSSYTAEPRYGLPVAPLLALMLASGLVTLLRQAWAVGAVLAAIGITSALSLNALLNWSETHPRNFNLAAPDLNPLVQYLSAAGVDAVYAEYWVSYALAAATNEDIVASPFVRAEVRYQPYEREVRARSGPAAYVLFRQSTDDDAFRARLERFRLDHRRDDVGSFSVYWLDPPPPDVERLLRAPPP